MQRNVKNSKALLMTAAIAGMIVAAQANAEGAKKMPAKDMMTGKGEVKCYGVNACKGKGACGSKKNHTSCAGSNGCKGKGWTKMKAADCAKKGGKTTET